MIARDGASVVRLARRVREDLGQRARYAHVLAVARTAARIARAGGLDADRARTAGLLHDLARLWDRERLLREAASRALEIDDFEREQPIVLHARLGAELARERYGIDDPAVLSAIARHTVGAPAMSPLDEAVFLADAVEPGRRYPERAAFAALALHDRRAAMRAVIENSAGYLRAKGDAVAPQTRLMARDYGLDLGGHATG